MYDLDNPATFKRVASFTLNSVLLHGNKHRQKRTQIREQANSENTAMGRAGAEWWAFRISVKKSKPFCDIENVSKLIVDSFSKTLARKDKVEKLFTWLFADDDIQNVRAIYVHGEPSDKNEVKVEIFAKRLVGKL